MATRKWTKNQNLAIISTGGTVLVSAAAGSGKTAVLVERIIRRICDEKNPCDIDKLLIITFTDAAANELKIRISEALNRILDDMPDNLHIQRQRILIRDAQISTIDSFCKKLVDENFYQLGIKPDFEIIDENQSKILKETAINELFEEIYSSNSQKYFEILNNFCDEKSDKNVKKVILEFYDKLMAFPYPANCIDNLKKIQKFDENEPHSNVYVKTVIEYISKSIECSKEILENIHKIVLEDKKLINSFNNAISQDLLNLTEIGKLLNICDLKSAISKINNFNFERSKPLRNYEDSFKKNFIQNSRNYVKKRILANLKEKIGYLEDFNPESLNKVVKISSNLFELVMSFGEKFYKLKRDKNVADFDDLEHWAISLLVGQADSKSKKTELAEELSKNFMEIMVDECQDINETQDMIINAVSRNGGNIFMVGDAKQSIYKFRNALPEIFLDRKNRFEFFDENIQNYPSKVILDKNFRSDSQIIDAINFIFENLMSRELGDIDYNSEEKLIKSAENSESCIPDVTLEIIEVAEESKKTTNEFEAERIAEIIFKTIGEKSEINGHPVTFRDFCILHRSANVDGPEIVAVLNKFGIPTYTVCDENLFEKPEIIWIMSILKIIVDPSADVDLVAILTSPIFDFSFDELNVIRGFSQESIFEAMNAFCENTPEKSDLKKKCLIFFEKLKNYQLYSKIASVSDLLDFIDNDLNYTELISTISGKNSVTNFRFFCDYIEKEFGNHEQNLDNLVNFLYNLEKNGSGIAKPNFIDENANAVRFMSIHKSKGLEFPICIVAGCSKKFNDDKTDFSINHELGVGFKTKNSGDYIKYDNLFRTAISIKNSEGELSEQMRILYVALTRAKKKLFLIMTTKNIYKLFENAAVLGLSKKKISPIMLRNEDCFTKWVIACCFRMPNISQIRNILGIEDDIVENKQKNSIYTHNFLMINTSSYLGDAETVENLQSEKTLDNSLGMNNNENFTSNSEHHCYYEFNYQYKDFMKIPKKLTVSDISKNVFLEKETDVHESEYKNYAEIGTAYHKFLYYAKFENLSSNYDDELHRAIIDGFLTQVEADYLDKIKIVNFTNTELFSRIIASGKYFKEYEFTVRMPISCYNLNDGSFDEELLLADDPQGAHDENILINGSVDCFFIENNKIVICDYKTDRVEDINLLKSRYSKQLKFYKYAVQKCENLPVKELVIYSFHKGETLII